MALKAFVKNIEEVEEQFRGFYVEEVDDKGQKTGRWKLNAEGVEDVTALRSAHERQKRENQTLREQAERFKNINPEEYQRLQREAEQREAREEAIRREAEDRIREATDAHNRALEAVRAQLNAMTERYHALFLDQQLGPEIAEQKGDALLLMPHIRPRARVKDDKGMLRLEVLNAEGAPMLTKDGKSAAIKDLVTEFRESDRFGKLFEGTGNSGSGAGGREGKGGGNGEANPFAAQHWNKTEQIKLIKTDAEAAEAAAIKAGFKSLQQAQVASKPIPAAAPAAHR